MDMIVAQMNVYKAKHDGAWATNNHTASGCPPNRSLMKYILTGEQEW